MHSHADPGMKVCVLGDSHVVALRRAYLRDPTAFDGLQMTWVAAARDGMKHTRFVGSRLEPTNEKVASQFRRTSSGDPSVDLARFDAVAICALGLSLQSLFWVFNTHLPAPRAKGSKSQHLISNPALRAVAADLLGCSIAARMVSEIRRVSTAPLFVIPQPVPEASIKKLSNKWPWLAGADTERLMLLLRDSLNQTVLCLCKMHSATALLQPMQTLDSSGFTREAFRQASNEDDPAHMNADYGLVVLAQLRAALLERSTLAA